LSRISRQKSNSGIYHIIVRGINKQDIFYDKQDYSKFIKEISNTKGKYQYELYAYCLMPNHVHLEIKDNRNFLESIMRSLMVAYVSYFNKKYERVGHLFQDRYLSKRVETDKYVLDLQRYIHQNPEKAGIAKKEEYRWSSYKEYLAKEGITDTKYVMQLFNMDVNKFKEYNSNYEYDINTTQELEMIRRLTDEQAKEIIQKVLQIENLQEIQKYNKKAREGILSELKCIDDISCAQIARVIGLNKKMIERYMRRSVPECDKMSQREPSPMRQGGR